MTKNMTRKLLLMVAGGAIATLVAAGCKDNDGNDTGGAIGDPCEGNGDCDSGFCFDLVEGGYCSQDCSTVTCPDATVCVTSMGQALCSPECTTTDECGLDRACVGGACVVGCEADVDCGGEGQFVCERGGCVIPTTVQGEVYDSDTLEPIEGARVVIIDNDTMSAAAPVAITDVDGMFSQRVVLREDQTEMGFTLSVAASGYMPLRPAIPALVERFTTSDVVPVALIHDPDLEGLGRHAGRCDRRRCG